MGEYLLGYPNEYGGYTDRPLLDPQRDPQALLPCAEDQPLQADLGRNGSYLVLRQLRQDVYGFWQFVNAQAAGDAVARERLALALESTSEKLIETTPGAALVELSSRPGGAHRAMRWRASAWRRQWSGGPCRASRWLPPLRI